jgi:ribosomal protein L11 methyltransferase
MNTNFVEVSIHANVDSGELLAMLEEDEALGGWENDGILHIYWPDEKWNPAALEDLKKALAQLGIDSQEAELKILTVPDQDWNAAWAASLHPIRLGRRFRIRQSWHAADPGFDGIELVIDPKRAFGTGYHATTQLVIEWLENNIRGGERVLDVGTGTGILAMSAIRLGAASALGIDNDPVALECAREYAAGNGFGPELELKDSSFDDLDRESFNIVAANLDIRTMPRFCGMLRSLLSDGGLACLSGLQEQDYEEIDAVLDREGYTIIDRRQKEDWLALTVKWKSSTERTKLELPQKSEKAAQSVALFKPSQPH